MPEPAATSPAAAAMPIVPTKGRTEAIHIGASDLPWVPLAEGVEVQLLQVDLSQGLWVINSRFAPGTQVETHFHTGQVFAVTSKGSWYYKEYPDYVNSPGSYLFEPAGSVHTLMIPKDQEGTTDVWFAIYGANINIDANGSVTSIVEPGMLLDAYNAACEAMDLPLPGVIVNGAVQGKAAKAHG